MAHELFPQAREMADPSMVRTLAAQAEAIWPQERPLLERLGLGGPLRILDGGCGTGEITGRLAALYPDASVLGVDLLDGHLDLARERHRGLAPRVAFEHRSLFELGLPEGSFDLVVCRHVLQSIPHPERALAELARVTRRGGWLHLVAEDYGMIHFPRRRRDPEEMWGEVPARFAAADGIDMHVGRNVFTHLRALGLSDVAVDYVVVDTLRVPRPTFAAIWEAWRDGYVETAASRLGRTEAEVREMFDDQIATLLDPDRYAAWLVPVVTVRVP
jgi:ubiquinone/menaquinone biosynthesis C-methylase UbiE